MLLFLFLMLEMGSTRIGFIFNFKDDWTNPRIEVIFGLRFDVIGFELKRQKQGCQSAYIYLEMVPFYRKNM